MRIANCTTAAQYFHLLRRQAALLHDRSAAARRADAEEPAAPPAGRLDAARAGRRALPHGDRRRRRREARAGDDPARARLQRQGLRRSRRQRAARAAARDVAICRVEQLYPVPAQDLRAVLDALSERRGDRLGAGRAGEHGRLGLHPSAPRSRPPAAGRVRARGAAAQREPGRRARRRATRVNQQALVEQAFGADAGRAEAGATRRQGATQRPS